MDLDPQLAAANASFDALVTRVDILENHQSMNKDMLALLVKHSNFFTNIVTQLEPKLNELTTRLDALDEYNNNLDKDTIPRIKKSVGQAQLDTALKNFRAEMTTMLTESTQVARVATVTVSKPRAALPDAFSGKREDWKSFQSSLDLFFLTHDSAYPTDTEKIMFIISRLGTNTAASKFMEPYIPKFRAATELRPSLITDLAAFIAYMSKNFGVTNSHVVAEINLRRLKQIGSALDYTNKFISIAADVKWSTNDDAMISAYRVGLKESILEVLARDDEPETFAEFTKMAIAIDTRQYSYFLTRSTPRNTPSSSTTSTARTTTISHVSRASAPAPAAVESGPSPMDLGHAQHKPLDATEKQRRRNLGLCSYCGGDDHWVDMCTNKPAGSKPAGNKPNPRMTHAISAVQTSSDHDVVFDLGKDSA